MEFVCAINRMRTAHRSIQLHGTFYFSCAMALRLTNVLSPENGSSCHRRRRDSLAAQDLSASTAASGPHDFAVRLEPHTSVAALRPSHLTARS